LTSFVGWHFGVGVRCWGVFSGMGACSVYGGGGKSIFGLLMRGAEDVFFRRLFARAEVVIFGQLR
jgi:hypothetical protein